MRAKATAYRLGDETTALIDQLERELSRTMGLAVSATDVVRLAIRDLARKHGLALAEKKKQKKATAGID